MNSLKSGCPDGVESRFDFAPEIVVNKGRIDPKRCADALDLKLFRGHIVVPAKFDSIFHGLPGGSYNVDASLRRLLA
jgi:hypothetical protein